MTAVGMFGLLLGLCGCFFAFTEATRARIAVFAAAYLVHVAAAVFYYELVKNGVGDSALYYYDPNYMFEEGFGLNTAFIVYIVQLPKSVFGGSYLDYFLVFQAIGFFGLALLMRIFQEVHAELGVEQPGYTYLLLFMPSLHYWTCAIGKEPIFFFAMCLSLWAAMHHKRRLITLVIGMLLMLAIRPHIAVIAGAAFTIAVLIDRNTRVLIKIPLFAASLAGTVFAAATVWSTFQIDLTNVDVYSDLLAGREALLQTEDAGRTAVTGSYPIRVLSLLFRPLFFDAGGLLGTVVSFENALFMVLLALLLWHLRTTIAMVRKVAFFRYAIICAVAVTIILALGYYNVGLGIRQKATMILPQILVAFVAAQALRSSRRTAVPVQAGYAASPSYG